MYVYVYRWVQETMDKKSASLGSMELGDPFIAARLQPSEFVKMVPLPQ